MCVNKACWKTNVRAYYRVPVVRQIEMGKQVEGCTYHVKGQQ